MELMELSVYSIIHLVTEDGVVTSKPYGCIFQFACNCI